MSFQFILADSGGTSTTWAFVRPDGSYELFETESLHPKVALKDEQIIVRVKKQLPPLLAPLFFYGAGCSTKVVQKEMQFFLGKLTNQLVCVFPDTLAVCRALHGNKAGWIGIFGTGSVVVQYDGKKIIQRIGGWGSLIGDEGSGYYFGKLLLRHVLTTTEWNPLWIESIGTREEVIGNLSKASAQSWISTLASKTAHLDLDEVHADNLNAFFETYGKFMVQIAEISLVGSYAFHQNELFSRLFNKNGITVQENRCSPIVELIDYHLNN